MGMELLHTSGPWALDDRRPGIVHCDDSAGSAVADTNLTSFMIPHEQKAANARLIAQAPALIKALIRMLPYLDNLPEFQQREIIGAILKAAPELKEHLQKYPLAA